MKIVSWNVNGIRSIAKKDFFDSVEKIDADILCLQETKAQVHEVEAVLSEIQGYHRYYNSAERKGYSGTAILSKIEPISVVNDMGVAEHDAEGRVQCAEFENFYLVNVYVPNSGQQLERLDYRAQWDLDFQAYLKNLEETKPVILCGDLNVSHQPIDLKNDKSNYNKTAGYTQVEIDGMTRLLSLGFIDSFRFFYPDKEAYTYWSYRFKARERNVGWRLDYFIVSENFMDKIEDSNILPQYFGSDHCPVVLNLNL
ncbi:MAG TPA: exodeoxyribonuclease III [Flavobacteriaceae bacterium]|nr:exodeoxyribonuclease III [Flavobacteriaceae bacterium]